MIDFTRTGQGRYNLSRKAQSDFIKRSLNRELFMKRSFERAMENTQRRIFELQSRYADRAGISLHEAKARANAMDVRAWSQYARKAVMERDFSDETNEWLRTFNFKMNLSREELLKTQIEFELGLLYSDLDGVIVDGNRQEFIEELRSQLGVHRITISPNLGKDFQRIMNTDFYGATFSERIWGKNGKYESLRGEIFDSLTNMMLGRGTYQTEVNKMMDRFGVAESDAFRLIRTETRRMNNQAAYSLYNEWDFSHYVYVAEAGACRICAPLNNKIIAVDDAEEGYNFPLKHPNCFCSTYGVHRLEFVSTGITNIDMHENEYGTVDEAYGQLHDIRATMK